MIVLKTLAKRDSEWFTDSLFAGGRYSIHWGEGWDEYLTSASTVIWRTAKRKKSHTVNYVVFCGCNKILEYGTALHYTTELGSPVAYVKQDSYSFLISDSKRFKSVICLMSLPARWKSVCMFDTRASIETGSFFAQKRIYGKRREKVVLSFFFWGCSL